MVGILLKVLNEHFLGGFFVSSSVISPLERPERIALTYACSFDQFWSASKQSLAMGVNWSAMKVTTGDSDWLAPRSILVSGKKKTPAWN